jgi:hypothetical protein
MYEMKNYLKNSQVLKNIEGLQQDHSFAAVIIFDSLNMLTLAITHINIRFMNSLQLGKQSRSMNCLGPIMSWSLCVV